MDLTRLPVSLSKVRSVDKAGILADRKQYWDRLFDKYERLSQVATDEESLHEIDRPINVQKREETFQSFNREIPGSRTFRRWVAEHGEEIDELTTIAGPIGEDEDDIEDHDSSDEDEDYEIFEETTFSDHLGVLPMDQNYLGEGDSRVDGDDICEDSNTDLELSTALPRQLQISQMLTPIKKNSNFVDKSCNSPKLSSSFNNSALTLRISELSMNLSCQSCGNQTNYSTDMGIKEKDFECDDCMLSVHPECEEDCKLCQKVAGEVEARWLKRRNFDQPS